MYASNKQQKAQERLARDAQAQQDKLFGNRPEFEAPEYNPIYQQDPGYAGLVRQIINGNRSNVGAAGRLSAGVNQRITKAARDRISTWDPTFQDSIGQMASNRDAANAGVMPYSDVQQIAGARGRAAGDFGYAGGAGPQTARDLGMTRSQLMLQQGPQLSAQITDILNAVDPIQRHSTPNEYLLPTQFGVQSAINENQFGANFGFQNAMQVAGFNALPDPQARGMFDIRAMQAGMAGQNAQQLSQGLGSLASIAGLYYGGAGGRGAGAAMGAQAATSNMQASPATQYNSMAGQNMNTNYHLISPSATAPSLNSTYY